VKRIVRRFYGCATKAKVCVAFKVKCDLYKEREFSLASIHKVLSAAKVRPLVQRRRPSSESAKRYSKLIPGERIQIDTMKIASHLYQYTAIDDCSRRRVLGLHPKRNAQGTLLFLDRVVEEMPFPIQRIQTDRGTEFFAEIVHCRLMQKFIKFRPIPPRSPRLKVERSQLTDRIEFWSRYDGHETRIHQWIEEWQFEYHYRRPHGSLNGASSGFSYCFINSSSSSVSIFLCSVSCRFFSSLPSFISGCDLHTKFSDAFSTEDCLAFHALFLSPLSFFFCFSNSFF
jgi:hypothetical protein